MIKIPTTMPLNASLDLMPKMPLTSSDYLKTLTSAQCEQIGTRSLDRLRELAHYDDARLGSHKRLTLESAVRFTEFIDILFEHDIDYKSRKIFTYMTQEGYLLLEWEDLTAQLISLEFQREFLNIFTGYNEHDENVRYDDLDYQRKVLRVMDLI